MPESGQSRYGEPNAWQSLFTQDGGGSQKPPGITADEEPDTEQEDDGEDEGGDLDFVRDGGGGQKPPGA
jgi:hypothetical protein